MPATAKSCSPCTRGEPSAGSIVTMPDVRATSGWAVLGAMVPSKVWSVPMS